MVEADSGAIFPAVAGMDTSIERQRARYRRDLGLAVVFALVVQAAFTAALTLPETRLAVPLRLILGLASVPISALCGTLFLRGRQPERRGVRLVLLFWGLVVIIVLAGFLFSAATGNYDLP